jgi:hypothetical protein
MTTTLMMIMRKTTTKLAARKEDICLLLTSDKYLSFLLLIIIGNNFANCLESFFFAQHSSFETHIDVFELLGIKTRTFRKLSFAAFLHFLPPPLARSESRF